MMQIIPENQPMLLLGSFYNGNNAVLRFYDPMTEQVYQWIDKTNYRIYCYIKPEDLDKVSGYKYETVEKVDIIQDKNVKMIKVIGARHSELAVPTYDGDIRYHESYLYDNALTVGCYYQRKGDRIEYFEHPVKVKEGMDAYTADWAKKLSQPIPTYRRVAIDIEVEVNNGKMPDANEPFQKITAIGVVGSDGLKRVFATVRPNHDETKNFPELEVCAKESDMLLKAFSIINQYPILLTFNGDSFDVFYLYKRAIHVGIAKSDIPFIIREGEINTKKFGVMQAEATGLKHGIHIDLFRFFSNKTIQGYAYGNKYKDHGLDDIAEGLLGENKIHLDTAINDLSTQDLAFYCLRDTELTLKLTSFNNDLTMKLITVIARIGRLSIDDLSRLGVNQWVRSSLYYEHRQRNWLIPRRDELEAKGGASTVAMIGDKKYRGADVVEPKLGIYFNVVVVDFASLYPSIIKTKNLSHETVRCNHEQCKSNIIPGTNHWVCIVRKGIASIWVGALRDLRVQLYKPLGKDKTLSEADRETFKAVEQAIKVILNASYGVLGAEIFSLYCLPVADCVTAVGRSYINGTINKAKELGIKVEYGDTDSIFCSNPTKEQVESLISWVRTNYGIDLEVDKEYRYVAFSGLKKNYAGVFKDGKVDVKGLTGKKSHTPPFIRDMFNQITETMKEIQTPADVEPTKIKFKSIVNDTWGKLKSGELELASLRSTLKINKKLEEYGREGKNGDKVAIPHHIKAAMEYQKQTGKEIGAGSRIAIVKVKEGKKTVSKPVDMVSWDTVDKTKYMEEVESVVEQILSCFGMDFRRVIGLPVQTTF
jgi:DNA polymerase I